MEAVLLVGLQASGKSTFYKERLFTTHLRLNLDMLKTRHREMLLIAACLSARQRFVIDNTNPTREDRRRYIGISREAGFQIVGFYFQSKVEECKFRNERRQETQRVPLPALLGTYSRIEIPQIEEGFDRLSYVRIDGERGFVIEEWNDEIR